MAARKRIAGLTAAENAVKKHKASLRKAEAKVRELRLKAKLEREIKAKQERLRAAKKRTRR